ncbi:hypothetical protein EC988_004478 [Linderina pennispora]|nr:hypothetical protein EC988_004478 [Linderina pennispora]
MWFRTVALFALFTQLTAATWSLQQKVLFYTLGQQLAKVSTGTPNERTIYIKLAEFLEDKDTAKGLNNDFAEYDYRESLYKVMEGLNTKARAEAIKDPNGQVTIDFLLTRLRQSYAHAVNAMISRQ